MTMANRFDYVKYDSISMTQQTAFKAKFQELEGMVEMLAPGRAQSLVYTKLEEAYMWVGKAIRDQQVLSRGAELQEGRGNE